MSTEILFRQSLQAAQDQGLSISFGSMFDWSSGKLTSVDAIGSVLLTQDKHLSFQYGFPKGWLAKLSKYIEKTSFWIHNFSMGFNHGYQIWILPSNSIAGSMEIGSSPKLEEASRLGILLRKEFR